jgi:hypothetical protein
MVGGGSKARPESRESADVTEAVYEAGYGSSRRIYERAGRVRRCRAAHISKETQPYLASWPQP